MPEDKDNQTFEAGRRQERLYFLGRFLRLWDAEASLVALGEIKSTLIALGVAESDLDSEPVVALARRGGRAGRGVPDDREDFQRTRVR